MNDRHLIIDKRPHLHEPALVTGFAGWPNAAGVSSETVTHLKNVVGADKIGEIVPEEFFIFTSIAPLTTRPITIVKNGVVDELIFPSTELFACATEGNGSDLLLLTGIEPDLKWKTYVDTLFGLAKDYGVKRLYTIGGYYDNVPHTKEPRVSAVVNDSVLKKQLEGTGVIYTDYEGPTSIQTYLHVESRRHDMECIGLWGAVPYYIKVNYPKAYHKVLTILGGLLGLELDLSFLQEAARKLDSELADKIKGDPKLAEYVKGLERTYEIYEEPSRGSSGEDIAFDIQEFLKRQRREKEEGEE